MHTYSLQSMCSQSSNSINTLNNDKINSKD